MPNTSSRSAWRRATIVLFVSFLAILVAVLAVAAAREAVVGKAIRDWFEAEGAAPAQWSSLRVGFGETRLVDFRIGPEFVAEHVIVQYRWPDVLSGRIAHVQVHGLMLDVAADKGVLSGIIRRRMERRTVASASSVPAIRIENAKARVAAAGRSIAVDFDGDAAPDGTVDIRIRNAAFRISEPSLVGQGLAGTLEYRSGQLGLNIQGGSIDAGGLKAGDLSLAISAGALPSGWRIAVAQAAAHISVKGRDVMLESASAVAEVKSGDDRPSIAGRIIEAVFRQGIGGVLSQPYRANGAWSFDGSAWRGDATIAPPGSPVPIITIKGGFRPTENAIEAQLSLASTKWGEGGLRLADLSPELKPFDVPRGRLAATAAMSCANGRCDGSLSAELDKISIAAPSAWIEDLSGKLHLARLNPPTSIGVQQLEAARIALAGGPVELPALESPGLRFRIGSEPDGRIATVERAEVGLVGMRLSVTDAAIAPGAKRHLLMLGIEEADLLRLLPMLGIEGVSGTGSLKGTIPIAVEGETITVTDGRLAAIGPGVLRIQNEAIRRALASSGDRAEIVARAVEDFRYSKLSLSLDKDAGGEATLGLSASGHNPAVLEGHPLALNVNLTTNVDRLLRQLQQAYALSDRVLGATMKK